MAKTPAMCPRAARRCSSCSRRRSCRRCCARSRSAIHSTPPQVPAAVLGYNNLEFENIGADPTRPFGKPLFRGFSSQPATLYMAFSVPAARQTFPNRAISLYHALRSFQYGELATPLHPDLSVLGAAANTVATHRFTVSNPGARGGECRAVDAGWRLAACADADEHAARSGRIARGHGGGDRADGAEPAARPMPVTAAFCS